MKKPRHYCRDVLIVKIGASLTLSTVLVSMGGALAQAPIAFDADGVQMLRPSAAGGSHLRLGSNNPNRHPAFGFDYKTMASAEQENGLPYWHLNASALTYASGAQGYTARLHLYASGGKQQFNWKTQKGHLSQPGDVRNQEFTVYVRVHELLTRVGAQVSLKIRGGGHHAKDPDAASATMMTFAPATHPSITRFGKELSHPIYDYVKLKPEFDASLQSNVWTGLKLLSWTNPANPQQVINQLYLDNAPFDATGKPSNRWRLFSQYVDEAGKNTGHYAQLADWGGWQTTLRVDGYRSVDLAWPSVREILPP